MANTLMMEIEWFKIPLNDHSIQTLKDQLGNDFLREGVLNLLKNETISVTFRKKAGGLRTMICTNNPKTISNGNPPPAKPKVAKSSGTISVWDLEKNDWRAFIIDNVMRIDNVE